MIVSRLQTYTPYSFINAGYRSDLFQGIKKQTIHQCKIWIEQSNLRFEMMTFVFFRAVGFFSPYLSYQFEAMFGHLQALYLRFQAAREKALLENEINQITQDNIRLNARVQNLMETMAASVPATQQAAYENEAAKKEVATLTEQRRKFFLDKRSLLAERDALAEENRQLKIEKTQLIDEKGLSYTEKENVEKKLYSTSQKLEELQLLFNRQEDYRLLRDQLTQFHQLYLTGDVNQTGMIKMALTQLIPCYKTHKEALLNILKETIGNLPSDSPQIGCLEAIIRLEEEETHHLTQISQTLQLIQKLGMSIKEIIRPDEPLLLRNDR